MSKKIVINKKKTLKLKYFVILTYKFMKRYWYNSKKFKNIKNVMNTWNMLYIAKKIVKNYLFTQLSKNGLAKLMLLAFEIKSEHFGVHYNFY